MFTTQSEASPTSRRRTRIAATIVAVVVAVGLAIGGAAPVNAYQSYNSYNNGKTDITGYAIVNGPSSVYQPAVLIWRNGAASISTGQYVSVTYQLEIWTTSGWRIADRVTSNMTIGNNRDYVVMDSVVLAPSAAFGWTSNQTGSFRVSYLYWWGTPWSAVGNTGATTGQVTVVQTAAWELQCGIATCAAYNGYTTTWR